GDDGLLVCPEAPRPARRPATLRHVRPVAAGRRAGTPAGAVQVSAGGRPPGAAGSRLTPRRVVLKVGRRRSGTAGGVAGVFRRMTQQVGRTAYRVILTTHREGEVHTPETLPPRRGNRSPKASFPVRSPAGSSKGGL